MSEPKLLIIGGGVAGLSAGIHALQNGFATTIVEHNLALGGVCTAWQRGPYTIDGCIHWLTGGAFTRLYAELGVLDAVPLHVLESWVTYRDLESGLDIRLTRDLDAFFARLREIAPEDGPELEHLRQAIAKLATLEPSIDAPELSTFRESMQQLWQLHDKVGPIVHLRQPLGQWLETKIQSAVVRKLLGRLLPKEAPALFLAMVLGYLERGFLSRPVGGSEAFRAALEHRYRSLGGEVRLNATVDEILVEKDRATGVRIADGTLLAADDVISTSSTPETVLRLLGGRYGADATRQRLEHWKLFDPIVLVSFGVAAAYSDAPPLWVIDGVPPFDTGGRQVDSLYLRVCNDDPCFAPPGHTVVQAMLQTDYDFWATRGTGYHNAKDAVADATLSALAPFFPKVRESVRVTDVATPLSFWTRARSFRGAYEGWMPSADAFFSRVERRLPGLSGLQLAGQWVEPGGGIPVAVLSGRQAVQLLCAEAKRSFRPDAART